MPKLPPRPSHLLYQSYSARTNHELLVRNSSENTINSQTNKSSTTNELAVLLSPQYTPRQAMLSQRSTTYPRSFSTSLSSRSTPPPPIPSPTFLIVVTAGSLALLTVLAAGLYCCTRCCRRKKDRSKKYSRSRGIGNPRELERGTVIGSPLEAGRGSVGSGRRVASPSALEFSPPSPNWKPTLPSIAYLSSNPSASGIGNGLFSGRGQIMDAETIMREREPGRRRVYGGGGWSNTPISTVISSISSGSQSSSAPHHPETTYSGQPSQSGTLRVGIGMPAAPPLPSQAPRTYRPPTYHRRSRIMPFWPDNCANPGNPVTTGTRVQPRRGHSFATAPDAPVSPVPRIEVHLAQDAPKQTADKKVKRHSRKITHNHSHSSTSRSSTKSSTGDGLQRNNSTVSQSSRPVSGLGITTINLGRGSTGRSVSGSKNLIPQPSSPASPSDEDVRLAYRSSMASIAAEPTSTRERDGRAIARRKSASKDKRMSRFYPNTAEKSRTLEHPEGEMISPRTGSRSASLKRSNTTKRRGLGVGAVDQAVKSELHDMRSLGSESFDSLIAYLDEDIENEDDGLRQTEPRNHVSHNGRHQESLVKNGQERKNSVAKSSPGRETRVTREETTHVEKESYDAWIGSLNATPSELRLAHVDVGAETNAPVNGRMSLRAGRRSRSASESTQSNVQRSNKTHGKGYSVSRVPLGERDMNVDSRAPARNQSGSNTDASRNEMKGKVGMHVRALRARSASLKVRSEDKGEYLTRHGVSTVSGTESGAPDASKVTSGKAPAHDSPTSWSQPISERRQQHKEAALLSARPQETLSSLPPFSVPSTATQLYAAYPTSEDSSLAVLSDSTITGPGSDGHQKSPAAKQVLIRPKASGLLAAPSSKTACAPTSTSTSKSISSAAYIARCAPTPHFKSAAVMSFLAPSPSSASRHRLPSPELSRSRSRLSGDSTGSSESAYSAASAWGRRSEWVRESLTPRFDHLRSVLEGRFEETPPPPVPVLTKRKSWVEMR